MHSTPIEASAVPRYVVIKDTVRERIMDGTYRPMDQIPSEAELMTQFGVSRITVNRALIDLANEGVIFRIHGKGSFVSKPKATQDLSHLQGFSEAMEPQGFEVINRVLSDSIITAPPDVARELRLEPKEEVLLVVRVRLLNRAPVSIDRFYVGRQFAARIRSTDLTTRDLFSVLENECGVDLGFAEVRLEATHPNEEESEHLDISEDTPCLHFERTTFSASKTPLAFDRVLCRSDRFRYQIRTERAHPSPRKPTRSTSR
jgi:GntR family transcriptional regulator